VAAGVGTATPKGFGAGVEVSDDVALSSSGWRAGVFAGFGVSSSSRAGLVFPISLLLREDSFSWDFFFAVFGLGVGVWRRFDLCEAAPGSGVSRGVAFRDVASSSDFSGGFGLRARGESCASADLRSLPADSSVAIFALGIGVGAFFSLGEESVSVPDPSFANFACGIAVGAFSGVAEARCLFPDLSVDDLATGFGDFFGLGDDAMCVSICPDSSGLLFSSSSTWARRRLPTIAPEASAVASQMRKRTTATERNRAREAINGIVKKVKGLQS
jgi:hypothetical protein